MREYRTFNPGDEVIISYPDNITEGVVVHQLRNGWVKYRTVTIGGDTHYAGMEVEAAAEYVRLKGEEPAPNPMWGAMRVRTLRRDL